MLLLSLLLVAVVVVLILLLVVVADVADVALNCCCYILSPLSWPSQSSSHFCCCFCNSAVTIMIIATAIVGTVAIAVVRQTCAFNARFPFSVV